MQVTQSEENGTITIRPSGMLSGAKTCTEFYEYVSAAVDRKPGEIVIDLSKIAFIDSMCIGIVVGAALKCREKTVGFRINAMSAPVEDVLSTAGLLGILTVARPARQ